MRLHALTASIAAAALVLVLASPPAFAQAETSLTGETFAPFALTFSNEQCNPDGTSSANWSVFGLAFGPFTGTFTETGTGSFGPLGAAIPHLTFPQFAAGNLLTFSASFTIDSPAGTVTGTQQLLTPALPENAGTCFDGVATIPLQPLGDRECDLHYVELVGDRNVHYDATIVSPTGTAHDSGEVTTEVRDLEASCIGGPVFSGDGLTAIFSSSQLLTTPGKATGGGQISGANGNRLSFGFNADSADLVKGHCSVLEHTATSSPMLKVKCLDVTTYTQTGNHAVFSGNAEVDGNVTGYRIDVVDNGEPGTADTFIIQTDSGFGAGGTLTAGDIQVH